MAKNSNAAPTTKEPKPTGLYVAVDAKGKALPGSVVGPVSLLVGADPKKLAADAAAWHREAFAKVIPVEELSTK